MPAYDVDVQDLNRQFEQLENGLNRTAKVSAVFKNELSGVHNAISATSKQMLGFKKSLNTELKSAFSDLIFEGAKLSDVLRNVGQSIISTTLKKSISPITDGISDGISGFVTAGIRKILPFEKGNTFSQGQVMPFAKGGVVSTTTLFPLRNGTGLMGEVGPEAIMPLGRDSSGNLGVRGTSGGNITINMTIKTPDVTGFNRSQSQIAAKVSSAIQQGQRNF